MIEGRMAAQEYQYDVFFSYKRHSLTLEWTKGVVRLLRLWLEHEVGREISVFVDEDCIETGDRWPETLRGLSSLHAVWSAFGPLRIFDPIGVCPSGEVSVNERNSST